VPESPTLRLIGGPTALITYGGLQVLTDPTFSPPGDYPRPDAPVVLHKLEGPEIPIDEVPPIDVVLLSHDHHADNLDPAGRQMLPQAGLVLTTSTAAERLDADATGLEPGASIQLERPGGGTVEVTAVPADHGPPEVAAKNGPVIGFVLGGENLPTLYVSGDNASVNVVKEVVAGHGPIEAAVLFVGGASVPERWGPGVYLTLTPETAVGAAEALGDAVIAPIHQDGWTHFSFGPQDTVRAFADAGLSDRLRPVAPGEQIDLR
jgi:L-ascorbate metabolism protein UlaG (beta-lactamase superfamily)